MFGNDWSRFGWQWNPWSDFLRLQEDMNRLFGDYTVGMAREFPAINLWHSEDDLILTAELPGVEPNDLEISVHDNNLTLRGTRKADTLKNDETYHRQERGSGNFSRSVQLPYQVDSDKVEARLEKGVLRLTLPRAQAAKPKKIEVTVS